jgi:hypothetical protein
MRLAAVVVEGGTNLADSIVDAALSIEVNIAAPYTLDDLFSKDESAPPFHEHDQEFERLALQPHTVTGATQLELGWVKLKIMKT